MINKNSEESVLTDVRAAKQSLDAQFTDFQQLAEHLRTIEQEYLTRTGRFADFPRHRAPRRGKRRANTPKRATALRHPH